MGMGPRGFAVSAARAGGIAKERKNEAPNDAMVTALSDRSIFGVVFGMVISAKF